MTLESISQMMIDSNGLGNITLLIGLLTIVAVLYKTGTITKIAKQFGYYKGYE